MHERDRRRIQARFMLLFGYLPIEELAELLGVSRRSIRRMQGEKHAPVVAVAVKMKNAVEEAISYAKMSPDERKAAQDRERALREARQKKIKPQYDNDNVKKEYPNFMQTALKRLREGKYQTVIDVLHDRIEEKEEWAQIPAWIRPYVLETLAFAYYRKGMICESISMYNATIKELEQYPEYEELRRACWSMRAGTCLYLMQFEQGFEFVEKAIKSSRKFAPGYYQGLCLATGTRDSAVLAEWMGRIIEAQSSWSYDGLNEFKKRCESDDPDLQWAQQQERWKSFLSELESGLSAKESHPKTISHVGV